MMDNSNIDDLTKDILSDSKLELTNSDFENLLMSKIRFERRKKVIFQNFRLFLIRFITLDAIIFSLSKIFGINITDITTGIDVLSTGINTGIQTIFSNYGYLILIYFIILSIVIILLSKILSTRYRY
jgi:hypothetical protein